MVFRLWIAAFFAILATGAIARPKIAVVDFDTHQYSAQLQGAQLADYVIDELVNTNLFDVIEREKLESVMREIGFGQSGMVDPSTAASFGRQLGARYLLTGRVISMDSEEKRFSGYGVNTTNTVVRLSVSIRVLDVESGRIEFSTRSEAQQVFNEGGGLAVRSSNPFAPLAEETAVNLVEAIRTSGKFDTQQAQNPTSGRTLVNVSISSEPAGADIEVDGIYYGNANGTIKLPQGLRKVRVSLSGYEPWEKQVMIDDGAEFTARLTPLAQ